LLFITEHVCFIHLTLSRLLFCCRFQQGCTAIKQWNADAEGEDVVKIATQNLVRFRLCPSDSCSAEKAAGCTAGYGDYIIGMGTFMESYFEAVQQQNEYECEVFFNNQCNCEDNGDGTKS